MTAETPNSFPIIGIGASAGGVEALEGFFRGTPKEPGVAFVVVTHLSPERESMLHEIVSRYTALVVHVATDGTLVEVDSVYVLGSDAIVSIEKGRLCIRRPDAGRRERKPIDIFLSSLAIDQGEFAGGVILSGGDGDGALGIKAIKERGGLTLAQVQDGYGPAHPDMPNSAISTGFVDYAIPADQMGDKLVQFARTLSNFDGIVGTSSADRDGESVESVRQEICRILRAQIGHEFAGYKAKTFLRRVQRRMQIRQIDAIEAYVDVLRQEAREVSALFRDLLINVTNFFRDADAFKALAETVVPELFEGRGAEDTLRIWVPGCATGEEVFSIGILLREHMRTLASSPRVQIFATDIDEQALSVARLGRYPSALLDSVSAERRVQFFVADGGSYVVAKEVRDLCIFSPHSVLRDPPFSRMDLVSCRNLLIYFGGATQGQVIPTFHYALRPGGYLFLGTSENITQFNDLFTPVERKHRIFRRRSALSSSIHLPVAANSLQAGRDMRSELRKPVSSGSELRQAIESQILDHFAPPHVVVNREGDIVFYSGRTGKYLEAAYGRPTRQIIAVARKGLRLDLRAVLRESVDSGRTVTREEIAVEGDDGRVQMISLMITPASHREDGEPLFLVLFLEHGAPLSREDPTSRSLSDDGVSSHHEADLRETRERLQSLIEEYETALEELKSSNEELVSVNEELQSTNEELEASKEEMQSVNEELHTLNADLNGKIDSLDRANSDLQNLFESTEVATVFLDRALVIRSFTPAVAKIFNILPADRGRPITDLSSRFSLPTFAADIADVFAGHGPVQRHVSDGSQDAHYLVRVGPYRNADQETEGVVVTFVDVARLTQMEAHQGILIAELQHRTRNLLTVVQSIARQTFDKSLPLDLFSMRLAALGRVQSLLGSATSGEVDLAEVIRLDMQAHGMDQNDRVSIKGPPVMLDVERVQTFALVLHELGTNALKHGALQAATDGRLAVSWSFGGDSPDGPLLVLDWRESGVAMPPDTSRRGYGKKLIERALPLALRARTTLTFGGDGVFCRIEMPLGSKERP